LCAGVGSREFRRQVGKVSKCELARVGFIADAEEADRILNYVTAKRGQPDSYALLATSSSLQGVLARFYAGLLFRVPVQSSEDHLCLRLDLGKFRLDL